MNSSLLIPPSDDLADLQRAPDASHMAKRSIKAPPSSITLKPLQFWNDEFTIPVEELPVLIGRSEEAHIRLEDLWVSRRHCELDFVDGSFVVRDLDSKHGVIVNGETVDLCQVTTGDRLSLGLQVFEVLEDD